MPSYCVPDYFITHLFCFDAKFDVECVIFLQNASKIILFCHFLAESPCNFAVMKETIQICNNGHLLDWMENGTLATVLAEIFTNEHNNFSQSFRFGSKFALDFPSRTEWRITAPNERCHGRFTQMVRQCRIKRYNKQRITCLTKWLSEFLREEILWAY